MLKIDSEYVWFIHCMKDELYAAYWKKVSKELRLVLLENQNIDYQPPTQFIMFDAVDPRNPVPVPGGNSPCLF